MLRVILYFGALTLCQATQVIDSLYDVQNAIRTLYREAPLIVSEELAQSAQAWAETSLQRSPGNLEHDYHTQNLAWSAGSQWPIEKAPCHWLVSEGHRATMLSSEVISMGCGFARSDAGTVVVCNYDPSPTSYHPNKPSVCNQIIHY